MTYQRRESLDGPCPHEEDCGFASQLGEAIGEHAPLPMAALAKDGEIICYANPAFCRMLKLSSAGLIGKALSALDLPDKSRCLAMVERARTGVAEPAKPSVTSHLPPLCAYAVWPIFDEGVRAGLIVQTTVVEKVHEQAVAMNEALVLGSIRQHELAEAAEHLTEQLQEEIAARKDVVLDLAEKARLLDVTHDAIVARDLHGLITFWNKGAERLYGWSCQEVIGEDLHLLLNTEFPKPEEQIIAQLYREGQFTGEVVQIARDGRRLSSLCRWVLDRETESILTSYTDISGVKRAEAMLRESEARYRSLFASVPMAVFVCDTAAVIQTYNRHAADLWGREPVCGEERLSGATRLRLPDSTLLPHEANPAVEVLQTGDSKRNVELLIERPDGSRLPVSANIDPLRDSAGEMAGVIVSFNDITERRLLEDNLVARAADLVRADRSKDEFLAMLAHELRNPLAPMRNATAILKAANVSEEDRSQAEETIQRQLTNMTRMIDDLLDVSRITMGKIELRRAPVSLQAVLTAVASNGRLGMGDDGQELTLNLPSPAIFVDADATRLEQVFSNLLGNARKYGGRGCHISLSAEPDLTKEPAEVVIRVCDDGVGIAPELLPRVFDLFVQATRALDRSHGGLGIGLTLVARLVHLHGGTVEAHSAGLGCGSEFTVRLPILIGEVVIAPAGIPPQVHTTPRRMLIVDDNEDSARSMATIQRLRGHDTRTAFNGLEAVAVAADFTPEVVLLDIGLPGMDGYEVARTLRAIPALDGAFIVAMTGYGSDEDRAHAGEAGFDEYVIKPVDLDLLRTWLQSRP